MERLEEWLPKELEEWKKDRVFAQICKLYENGLGYLARVIHSFLCRELVTYKNHELWFAFARRPLRFSLVEYHAVPGFSAILVYHVRSWLSSKMMVVSGAQW